MCSRTSIVLFLALWFGASAHAASSGLVLGFTVEGDIRLTSAAGIERAPRARATTGTVWRIDAIAAGNTLLWSRAFPAPRQFHASGNLEFSMAVPRVAAGTRLVIRDQTGAPVWSEKIDDAWLEHADSQQAALATETKNAKAATAELRAHLYPARNDAQCQARAASLAIPAFDDAASAHDHLVEAPNSQQAATVAVGFTVRGTVAIHEIDVRVFDADTGAFVVSDRADPDTGAFAFQLPRGRYLFEVDDNRVPGERPYFYRTPFRTAPVTVEGDTEVAEISVPGQAGEFSFEAGLPCELVSNPLISDPLVLAIGAEIIAADGTRIQRSDRIGLEPFTGGPGLYGCEVRYFLRLSPGRYSIAFTLPGWAPMRFDDVEIFDDRRDQYAQMFSLSTRDYVWSASVVDATGAAFTDFDVFAFDETGEKILLDHVYPPANHVELAYVPGWLVEIRPHLRSWNSDQPVRKRVLLDGVRGPDEIRIDPTSTTSVPEDGLLRIFGNGDRARRHNVLFLAEGFTDLSEIFTDVDGSGLWNGIVWQDFDGDRRFDPTRDGFNIYAPDALDHYPPNDPTSVNEPFVDVNGDGMHNVGEAAQFALNARDFLLSVLGSDFWEEHRESFNGYLLFEPSPQAGTDVTDASGQRVVERATRYGANLVRPGGTLDIDRQAATSRALAVLPEVDTVIVLVNQVVDGPRAATQRLVHPP